MSLAAPLVDYSTYRPTGWKGEGGGGRGKCMDVGKNEKGRMKEGNGNPKKGKPSRESPVEASAKKPTS